MLTYIVFDGMTAKPSVSAFQNLFQIENQLTIKKVMDRNVWMHGCVDVFCINCVDIHSIECITCFDPLSQQCQHTHHTQYTMHFIHMHKLTMSGFFII